MTTYIPALTLPDQIFANTAASILTPVVLGSTVGIAVSSEFENLHTQERRGHIACYIVPCF